MAVGVPKVHMGQINSNRTTSNPISLTHTGVDWWVTYLFINNDGYAYVGDFRFAPNMIHSGFIVQGADALNFANAFSGQLNPPAAEYKLDLIELS